jgi:hypothetical protein
MSLKNQENFFISRNVTNRLDKFNHPIWKSCIRHPHLTDDIIVKILTTTYSIRRAVLILKKAELVIKSYEIYSSDWKLKSGPLASGLSEKRGERVFVEKGLNF